MAGAFEPKQQSGIVATAVASTSAYITNDDLAVELPSLEGKIDGMVSFMAQSSKRWERFPSPDPPPVVEEEWVDIDEGVVKVELEGCQTAVYL